MHCVRPGIDRSSPIPYYHQLKAILLQLMASPELPAGARLPSEPELCRRFGVSRTVVRQALADLEFEGRVERIKGRGTFVAQERTAHGLVQNLSGLFEDAASVGRQVHSDVRRFEVVPAEPRIATELGLPVGDPVLAIERLRYVDDVPWVWAVTHLPAGLLPDLTRQQLVTGSLYAVMAAHGTRPVRGRRAIEARSASARVADDLGMTPGQPVLVLESVGYDANDRAVETFRAVHRGDRSRFEVSLVYSGSPATRWHDSGLRRAGAPGGA